VVKLRNWRVSIIRKRLENLGRVAAADSEAAQAAAAEEFKLIDEQLRRVIPQGYACYRMTKEDKILAFLKLRGGSGPIDIIRDAADIREAAVLRQSNPLAKKLIADGLLTHARRNHYVLTASGEARARELIER
jgi:hypothetical protein